MAPAASLVLIGGCQNSRTSSGVAPWRGLTQLQCAILFSHSLTQILLQAPLLPNPDQLVPSASPNGALPSSIVDSPVSFFPRDFSLFFFIILYPRGVLCAARYVLHVAFSLPRCLNF